MPPRTWVVAAGLCVLGTAAGAGAAAVMDGVAHAPPAEEAEARVIPLIAMKYSFTPEKIVLKKGEPVVLEIDSLDRKHGFFLPDFGIRTKIEPGATTRVRLVPDRIGTFVYNCDDFCGSGHEDMEAEIEVTE